MATNPRTVLGFPDLVFEAEGADVWVGGPDSTAVPEAAGFPVAALGDDLPGRPWRSPDLTEASGRVGRIFDSPRSFGVLAAADHNLTQRGLARFVGGDWVFRNAASIALAGSVNSTAADLDGHSDVTYYLRGRMPPFESPPAAQDIWRFGAGLISTDFDFILDLRTGVDGFRVTFARWSGGITNYSSGTGLDSGRPLEIMIQIDGTAARADLVLDGVKVLDQVVVPAYSAPTVGTQSAHIGTGVAFDLYEFVRVVDNNTITLAELRALAITARQDALPVWLSSGTFPVIDDAGQGSHTATTSGTVVQIDRVNDLPDVGGDTIKPWGAWSKVEALRLLASSSVVWTRAEAPPRRLTLTFLTLTESGAVPQTGATTVLFLGHDSATADLLIQIQGGALKIDCRRTASTKVTIGTATFDGDVHDIRITIDDRDLTMNVWIDLVQVVTNFTIGAYVSQATFNLNIFGGTLSRWTIANVLVTRGIHVEQSALVDSAPWVEFEPIFDVRLDGDTVDIVDAVAPTPTGSTEFVTISNPDTTADLRAGSVDEITANPLRGMPRLLVRDFTATEVREVAVQLWDPGNTTDGYFEIGSLRFCGSFRTANGRRQSAQTSYRGPVPRAVAGGGFILGDEARNTSFGITFQHLEDDEAKRLLRHFQLYGLERPFPFVIYADDDESTMPQESVWGLQTEEPRMDEHRTETRGRWEVTIEVTSMLAEPLRL